MTTTRAPARPAHDELLAMLRQVRRRWRLRLLLQGIAIVVVATLVALLVGAWAMDRLRFTETAVLTTRVVVWLALVGAAVRWLVLPLARRVPDERVALYVEEHEPSLDASLLSALEARRALADGGSPSMANALAMQAAARARAVEYGARVERPRLRRGAAGALAALAVAVGLVALGPAFVRSGARLVFWPWGGAAAEAAPVLAIAVKPGDITVARGADLAIEATLRGFTAEGAALLVRRGGATTWSPVPMTAGARAGVFAARLFDLDSAAQYVIEADGIRSRVHDIRVVDRPTVRTLAVGLRYPAYTGLAPVDVEDGGDVAAPRGTVVRVHATPTLPVRGGRLVIEGGAPVPLTIDSTGALVGAFRIDRPGFYRVELTDTQGNVVPGSLDYVIDVLPDRAPTITVAEPGRDMQATRLEEVFTSIEAEDDYGVSRMELVYSVNGGPEQTVVMHDGGARRTPAVTAGHTFFLEELPLKPGDVVSYFARARDNDAVSGAHTAATDIYFLRIRPFDRTYRQAEQGGGGQGEERGESPSALSERQREIVAATFKLTRDTAAATAAGARQRREDLATLALAQGRLREQTEALAERVKQRGGAIPDSAVQEIAAALPLAAAAMRDAEERLGRRVPGEALSPEQRALQQLQRAEAALREVQVSLDQQGGGGGGGGRSPEELADLFGLQTDRLRNQYESIQRSDAQRQATSAEVDRTLERLRELAARQQRESERLRREAEALQRRLPQSSQQQAGGGGGSSSSSQSQGGQQGSQQQNQQNASGTGDAQRQLAQEAEQMARTLERLARENPSPELQRSARQLQEAADAMRRAGASGSEQAAESAANARERLEAARRALSEARAGRAGEDAQSLQRRADALAEAQRRIGAEAERIARGEGRGTPAEAALGAQKDSLAAAVSALERDLDRAARDARTTTPDASRRLQEGANAIRDTRVLDKLRFSKNLVRSGAPDYVRSFEEQIGANLDDVRQRVAAAATAARDGASARPSQTLERARQLAQGMSSLGERLRQRREAQWRPGEGTDARGNASSPSRNGQGQQGQQGQGQRGQQGQQGQGQQAQGQAQGQGHGQGEGQGQGQGQGGQQQGGQGQGGGQGGAGGQNANAQRGGSLQGGGGDGFGGAPNGAGGLTAEDVRQFSREARERRADAEELRRSLAQQGMGTRELDALIARMRALERQGAYANPEALERLQADVADGLKALEFALRRRLAGETGDAPRQGGGNDVPAGFRALVDEYFRSLARARR